MMANNSTELMDFRQSPTSNVWISIVFAVEGTVSILLNVPIWAAIFRHVALRVEKQYVIVAGLALADSCNGFTFLNCGLYGIYVTMSGRQNDLVSAWECALTPHNPLWCWTMTVAMLMLVVVSADRLLSVAMPLRYLGLPTSYAWKMVGAAFGYSLVSGATGLASALMQPSGRVHPKICHLVSAVGVKWLSYFGAVNIAFIVSSISIYAIIGVLMTTSYRKKISKLLAKRGMTAEVKRQAQRQQKMTESLAICCFFTLIFYCIPFTAVVLTMLLSPNEQRPVGMMVLTVVQVNPMWNAVIYLTKHPEMRMAVQALFTGKLMAPSLRTWLRTVEAQSVGNKMGPVPIAKSLEIN